LHRNELFSIKIEISKHSSTFMETVTVKAIFYKCHSRKLCLGHRNYA